MGYYEDVYSSPEKHGLTMIGELELCGESYSFDIICAWKHENGKVYWGTDSGCSCPSPFENVMSFEGLQELGNISEIEGIVEEAKHPSALEKKDFLKAVEAALTK